MPIKKNYSKTPYKHQQKLAGSDPAKTRQEPIRLVDIYVRQMETEGKITFMPRKE